MTSKVQPAANYWANDVKTTSEVQPAADYWTVDWENLGMRLCYIWWVEKQRANGEIFWMNNKAIIEFDFRRIWRILQISGSVIHLPRPSGSVNNTLLDIQNSSYLTQPHSMMLIILLLLLSIIDFHWLISSGLHQQHKVAYIGLWNLITSLPVSCGADIQGNLLCSFDIVPTDH